MNIVVDASTFISAALKPDSLPEQALLRAMRLPNRLILSVAVADENRAVLARPKFDRYLSRGRRDQILELVMVGAEWVEVEAHVRECSDPNDDKYLSLASAGHAPVIVSGDLSHLVPMHPWRGVQILRPTDFLVWPSG